MAGQINVFCLRQIQKREEDTVTLNENGNFQATSIIFNKPEWFVDVSLLKSIASEISWNAGPDAVNPNCFSIDDFRFAAH